MSEEFVKFKESILDKSHSTQRNYLTRYTKLRELLGKDIHLTSQEKILEKLAEFENPNSLAAFLNIAILVRKQHKYSITELEKYRAKNKESIQKTIQMNNRLTVLPSLQELDSYIESLYQNGDYFKYIINYLLRNCYTRNEDLLFTFVDSKQDVNDTDNFIWVTKNEPRVVYYRNRYKTAKTYGKKENEIKDPKFYHAVREYRATAESDNFLYEYDSPASVIQRSTINKIGEGAMLKIIIRDFKDDIHKLTEISKSRGTSVYTLLNAYNLDF